MGFEIQRGDIIEISSAPFAKIEEADIKAPIWERAEYWRLGKLLGWGALAVVGLLFFVRLLRRTSSAMAMLKPGMRVGDVDVGMMTGSGESWRMVSGDNSAALRERARELGKTDPGKAAHLLKAWVNSDSDATREGKENAHV
jgi:flagellar biosynthesis/type III secretory pathway M-ring protein FliF/YscJ